MLSIGEFSRICRVSTKALRYYDEIGLLKPAHVNDQTGYRSYSTQQLGTMLLINRLKKYQIPLEEIRNLLETQNNELQEQLIKKKIFFEKQLKETNQLVCQLSEDILKLKQSEPIPNSLNSTPIQIVQFPVMNLFATRKRVPQHQLPKTYKQAFRSLEESISANSLSQVAPPMVLFHQSDRVDSTIDIEFAIPIRESKEATREFDPQTCLTSTLYGA